MTTTPIAWPEAQRICDIPEVREALDKFAADAHEENMLAMVSLIMGHASAQGRAAGLEEERAAFERWFAADTVPGSQGFFSRDPSKPDEYSIFEVQCEWRAWQARAALSPTSSDAGKDDALDADMVLMPRKLTARNGAKAALAGEFSEKVERNCATCHFEEHDGDCLECKGEGTWTQIVPVSWENIKRIYEKAVEHLGKPVAIDAAIAAQGKE